MMRTTVQTIFTQVQNAFHVKFTSLQIHSDGKVLGEVGKVDRLIVRSTRICFLNLNHKNYETAYKILLLNRRLKEDKNNALKKKSIKHQNKLQNK